ncbi:Transposon, En/Spm-like protein [Corchorus capsularis]|uniref:Transposon, En/Spm-like protein n=1 Tax=Corchorus capsularis TaxID=210143 RepID=A0A1R3KE14_COCAP|nr:Transposon, En/Spm-like protein [Corchorus capsularis]
MDKSWILKPRTRIAYLNGVDKFLDFAFAKLAEGKEILCPCVNCVNGSWLERKEVREHLICKGINEKYTEWNMHGEESFDEDIDVDNNHNIHDDMHDDKHDDMHEMLNDVFNDGMDDGNGFSSGPDENAQKFYNLLKKAEEELYPGSLMWTISDFPAYAMLSGWSAKGKLACPCCNYDTCYQYLRHSKKMCYMGHRRLLEPSHKWRHDRTSFDGSIELRQAPQPLSGSVALEHIKNQRKNPNEKGPWKKKSIFFELLYWEHNSLRHNLDVMHIEKNITDNILGTLLDIPGKSKDHAKAMFDLKDMGIRRNLQPQESYDSRRTIIPKAYQEDVVIYCGLYNRDPTQTCEAPLWEGQIREAFGPKQTIPRMLGRVFTVGIIALTGRVVGAKCYTVGVRWEPPLESLRPELSATPWESPLKSWRPVGLGDCVVWACRDDKPIRALGRVSTVGNRTLTGRVVGAKCYTVGVRWEPPLESRRPRSNPTCEVPFGKGKSVRRFGPKRTIFCRLGRISTVGIRAFTGCVAGAKCYTVGVRWEPPLKSRRPVGPGDCVVWACRDDKPIRGLGRISTVNIRALTGRVVVAKCYTVGVRWDPPLESRCPRFNPNLWGAFWEGRIREAFGSKRIIPRRLGRNSTVSIRALTGRVVGAKCYTVGVRWEPPLESRRPVGPGQIREAFGSKRTIPRRLGRISTVSIRSLTGRVVGAKCYSVGVRWEATSRIPGAWLVLMIVGLVGDDKRIRRVDCDAPRSQIKRMLLSIVVYIIEIQPKLVRHLLGRANP